MSLEECLELMKQRDELVEVTPVRIRMRKKILDPDKKKKRQTRKQSSEDKSWGKKEKRGKEYFDFFV